MGLWGDGSAAPTTEAAPSGGGGLWGGAPAARSPEATSTGGGLWHGLTHDAQAAAGAVGSALGDVVAHPGRAVMNAVNAPGRAAKSLLAGHGLSATTGAGDDSNRADIRDRLHLGEAGYDKAPQWLKGVTDFGIDTVTDPMTYVPGADVVKLGSRALGMANRGLHVGETLAKIPGVKAGAEKVGEFFDPHHETALFTEHGQNAIDRTSNTHGAAAQRTKVADDRIIAAHQAPIRAGQTPDPVKALMDKYGVAPTDVAKADPAAFRDALDKARFSKTRAEMRQSLQEKHLLPDGITGATRQVLDKVRGHDAFFKDPARADEAREALAKALEPQPNALERSALGKLIGVGNEKLKAAFLALPGAHMANLTNLAYNAQGPGVAARGLLRAAPIALGKAGPKTKALLDTLEEHGAHNQYAPLYSEANKFAPLRAGARMLNALQEKTLNATESGLRAEMLAKDLARGKTAEDSVRGIHRALGSDPSTGMTKFLNLLPASQFPRFHTQTAIGSGLRTLRDNPGRITTGEHALGMTPDSDDTEPTPDGDPHYHLSTPTAAFLKMMDNPVKYFTSAPTLGKLVDIQNPYSPLGALIRQKPGAGVAAGKSTLEALLGAVPGAQLLRSAYGAVSGEPGQAGESAGQDLLSALLGGYYAKK